MKPCAKYYVNTHWCLWLRKLNSCWVYVFHISYISGPRVLPSMCQSGCQGPLWTWRSVYTTGSTRTPSLSTQGEPSGAGVSYLEPATHWLWMASLLGWQRTGQLIRLWTLKKVILNIQEIPVLSRHCRGTQESQGQRPSWRQRKGPRVWNARHPKGQNMEPALPTSWPSV